MVQRAFLCARREAESLFIYLAIILWVFYEVEPFRSAVNYFFGIFPPNIFLTIIVAIITFIIVSITRIFLRTI